MKGRIVIMVLDRGFVIVGRAEVDPDFAFHWRLRPGRTIRRWGTSKGLAELKNGPLANTVLDPPIEQSVPWRAVLDILYVEESGWEAHLPLPGSETPPVSAGGNRGVRKSTMTG